MGEPLPGDIPDPIYLKTTNIPLQTNQVVSRGDWLIEQTNTLWSLGISHTFEELLEHPMVQAQEDQDTTGVTAGTVNAAAFGAGSWVYAYAGTTIKPQSWVIPREVDLGGSLGDKITFVDSFDLAASLLVVTGSDTGVFTVPSTAGVTVGTVLNVTTAADAGNVGTWKVTSITGLTITAFRAGATNNAGDATVVVDALVNQTNGRGRFIKLSGDTVVGNITQGEIGVFSIGDGI